MKGLIVFGLGCALAGAGMAGSAALEYFHSYASRAWPSAPATVIHSDLRKSAGSKGPSYWADVRYVYEVGGSRHGGNTVRFGPVVESREDAKEAVDKFGTGKHVRVYFDPDQPSVSVLEPGKLHGFWGWKLGAGLAFAGLGSVLVLVVWSHDICQGGHKK